MIGQPNQMKALDLFSGCGGSSYGARLAGVTPICAVDMWNIATETYSDNFPDAFVLNTKLQDIQPEELLERIGPVDFLLSSPECTNHSCAKGSRPRSEESRNTALFVLDYARVFRPRWLILENVIHMRPWARYAELISSLHRLGYRVRESILDASDFGVPQRRRRLFIMAGLEEDPKPVIPPDLVTKATAAEVLDPPDTWKSRLLFSPGRATATLDRAKRGFEALGSDVPFLLVYYGTDGGGGWQPLDKPLRTITTLDRFGLVEPSSKGPTLRMLQVPELRRAMGFGSDFLLNFGGRRERIKLLGNAVCPPVMKAVIQSLLNKSETSARRKKGQVFESREYLNQRFQFMETTEIS